MGGTSVCAVGVWATRRSSGASARRSVPVPPGGAGDRQRLCELGVTLREPLAGRQRFDRKAAFPGGQRRVAAEVGRGECGAARSASQSST